MRRETVLLMNVVFMLVLIGVLMVYSTSTVQTLGGDAQDPSYSGLYQQLMYVGIGVAALLLGARVKYQVLRATWLRGLLIAVTLGLLAYTLVFAPEINGARRWIFVYGASFQASELAKLTLIIVLAGKLADNQDHMHEFQRGFLPPILWTGLFALIVLMQNDLGSAVVMGAIAVILMLIAGAPLWQIGVTLAPGVAGALYLVIMTPWRLERVYAFLNPWAYRQDQGLQLIESLQGFARGGVWGTGLGGGQQKLHFLPYAPSDFIFPVLGEEMGLVGTLFLVTLFLLFLVLGRRIAVCAPDIFGTLVASGITFLISLQAGLNMGVTTGLLPTKGLALPFISSGGSSLLMTMVMAGILLNIGIQGVEPVAPPRRRFATAR